MKSYMSFASPSSKEGLRVATVILIDCSPSMEETDWKPSRLAAAQEATRVLIEEKCRQCPEDYVGIVSFGGLATTEHVLVPVGANATSLIRCLQRIEIKSATDIDAGLKEASALLKGSARVMKGGGMRGLVESLFLIRPSVAAQPVTCDLKHIICLSDGAPTEGNAELCASLIKKDGVLIDCIGIASRDNVDEKVLKAVASLDKQGRPRYRFIGDEDALVKEFRKMANHIQVMR
jgi:hypothetical protein